MNMCPTPKNVPFLKQIWTHDGHTHTWYRQQRRKEVSDDIWLETGNDRAAAKFIKEGGG